MITLRGVESKDLMRFYEILQNPNVYTKIDLETAPSMKDEYQWYQSIQINEELVWTIEYDGIIVGNCRIFSELDFPENSGEFGIIIDEKYWGRGIGTFVCKWLITFADEQLRLEQLFLEVKKSNHHAKRLYQKLGFQTMKILPEHERMVILFPHNKDVKKDEKSD